MKVSIVITLAAILLVGVISFVVADNLQSEPVAKEQAMKSIYDFEMTDIDGKPVKLSAYADKVVLIVNVASKCGFTSQYEGLQALYEKYRDQGLVVLGFPANNFMNQEPGTNQEIKAFCTSKYDVTFPMFSKISVSGDDMHPLYQFLTTADTNPEYSGAIKWNFNKFLIGKDGSIVNRFGSMDKPMGQKVVTAIEEELAK